MHTTRIEIYPKLVFKEKRQIASTCNIKPNYYRYYITSAATLHTCWAARLECRPQTCVSSVWTNQDHICLLESCLPNPISAEHHRQGKVIPTPLDALPVLLLQIWNPSRANFVMHQMVTTFNP